MKTENQAQMSARANNLPEDQPEQPEPSVAGGGLRLCGARGHCLHHRTAGLPKRAEQAGDHGFEGQGRPRGSEPPASNDLQRLSSKLTNVEQAN